MTLNELLERALFYSRSQQWDKAMGYAKEAVEKAPNNFLAQKRLSLTLWYSGHKQEAYDAMHQSVDLQPDFASAHYNLACFYASDQQKEEMLLHLQKAIELEEYSDYRAMALEDSDFDVYANDNDFLEIVEALKKEGKKLSNVFNSDDFELISGVLLKIDNEIPVEAVEWDYEEDGKCVTDVLEADADKISTEALQHLFKVTTSNPSVGYYDGFTAVLDQLRERLKKDFETLIIKAWNDRYACTDAGHLDTVDRRLLEYMEEMPVEPIAQLVLTGLKSHGADALQDFENLNASIFESLPKDHQLRTELVEVLDRYYHKDRFIKESLEARENRIRLRMPAPPLDYDETSDDIWAYQKAAIRHFHPIHVLNAASHLSIQRKPEIVDIARTALPRIYEFVLDTSLPLDLRIDAIKSVLMRIGEEQGVKKLGPALLDTSCGLLEALGELFKKFKVSAKESRQAVDFLLNASEKQDKGTYDLYDVVTAISWFQDDRIPGFLMSLLDKHPEPVRREAIKGLGQQGAATAIPQLVVQLRRGSGQCVSAAAKALKQIGGRALQELKNEDNYRLVLERAKKEPRWAIRGLVLLDIPALHDDLIELLKTTKEYEAYDHLSGGLARLAHEKGILDLVQLGMDRYSASNIGGRHFVEVFRAIARNRKEPDPMVVEQVRSLLSKAEPLDVDGFVQDMVRDGTYMALGKPTKEERQREMLFTKVYKEGLEGVVEYPEKLAQAMFLGQDRG